jgi:hypothetical protein
LKSTADRYGKKRKHVELFKEKLQEKVQTILQVGGGGKMQESFHGHIQEQVQEEEQAQLQQLLPNKEMIWLCTSLVGIVAVVHPHLL